MDPDDIYESLMHQILDVRHDFIREHCEEPPDMKTGISIGMEFMLKLSSFWPNCHYPDGLPDSICGSKLVRLPMNGILAVTRIYNAP